MTWEELQAKYIPEPAPDPGGRDCDPPPLDPDIKAWLVRRSEHHLADEIAEAEAEDPNYEYDDEDEPVNEHEEE